MIDHDNQSKPARVETLGEIGLQQFAPYLMNRIMGRYNHTLRGDLKSQGLTVPQARAMAVLSVMETINVNDLAIYAVIEQSTMSRTLDGLEEQGLVKRAASEQDSRVKNVSLTDKGRAEFNKSWPAMEAAFSAMFKDIDQAEYAALINTLHKMLKNIRQHEI